MIKPLVLHGQSNLHPLVALISILGGVQTLGPIGILVGPMLVAFIQALLNMINKELLRFGDATLRTSRRVGPLPLRVGEPATPRRERRWTSGHSSTSWRRLRRRRRQSLDGRFRDRRTPRRHAVAETRISVGNAAVAALTPPDGSSLKVSATLRIAARSLT